MRINKFVASASGMSRRAADAAISKGRIQVNGQAPHMGQDITDSDRVTLDGRALQTPTDSITIMLYKPVGYVVSRDGQGSRTIYDLLPVEYQQLKPIGRLDKDSSGLLLLTNDCSLANELTHPSHRKEKVYQVELNKPLTEVNREQIEHGIRVEDYTSRLALKPLGNNRWQVNMFEGKNRQIRKTFFALGYIVTKLHRTQFGDYQLGKLKSAEKLLLNS